MSEPPHDEVIPDAAVASEDGDARAYRVKLSMFEGPLDLLLHLIQKHELNILDIPIGFVAQKYVEYIRLMEEMSIDLASEYLVMAATLAHIKSRSLLPPDPTQESEESSEEEEEDPRAELIRKLLEYQKYKNAADNLGQREVLGRDVFARGFVPDHSEEEAPLAPMSLFKLMDAFEGVLKRAKQVQEHQIDFEKLSISDRIGQIIERLRSVRTLQFVELFDGDVTRADMIVTFLALLEMTKLRMTRLAQEGPLAPIVIELVLSADQVKDFNVERAFEQVYEAVEQDFAANLPSHASEMTPSSWDEFEGLEPDIDDEDLAEELHRAARALALGEEEPPPRLRTLQSEMDPELAGKSEREPSDQLSTFGAPEEDDFFDDLDAPEDVPASASPIDLVPSEADEAGQGVGAKDELEESSEVTGPPQGASMPALEVPQALDVEAENHERELELLAASKESEVEDSRVDLGDPAPGESSLDRAVITHDQEVGESGEEKTQGTREGELALTSELTLPLIPESAPRDDESTMGKLEPSPEFDDQQTERTQGLLEASSLPDAEGTGASAGVVAFVGADELLGADKLSGAQRAPGPEDVGPDLPAPDRAGSSAEGGSPEPSLEEVSPPDGSPEGASLGDPAVSSEWGDHGGLGPSSEDGEGLSETPLPPPTPEQEVSPSPEGSSDEPVGQTAEGPGPLSEPETSAELDRLQEGSQDPKGSDVESP